MTHHKPQQWLSLLAALLIGPLAPCAAAESGQWVAKGTQPKPLASASHNGNASTPEATSGGQQPVIIYLPQGTPVPSSQPSWVLEGFLKAKENAAKEAAAAPKPLTPVESPKPDSGAAPPEAKAFQPPTVTPRIASPVQTPTLAPPIVEGKPEGGGLFRWPDGMISEYSGDVEPPAAAQQSKRPKALFAPRTAKPSDPPTPTRQRAIAAPRAAPALPPSAPPTPQESQRRNGLVDAPRPSLMPTNRPPTRSAVVKATPPVAPQTPAEKPVAPVPATNPPERAEPRSVVVSPRPVPAEPSDAKALFPRSVISKYLPSDKSANVGSKADGNPGSRANHPWSKFLPSDPRSTARSAVRPPGPALPKVDAAELERVAPAPSDSGLAESGPAPAPSAPTPRSAAPKSRGKALFSRSRPLPPPTVETPIVARPSVSPKPPMAVAGPIDPFTASSKLMPQVPRQAKAAVQKPESVAESKVYSQRQVEIPREELARTAPIPLGHPSLADMQGSKRRVRMSEPAPQAPGKMATGSPTTKNPSEQRFVEQKGTPRPWKSAMETAELSPPRAATTQEAIAKPADEILVEPSPVRTAANPRPGRPVVEVVTAQPQPAIDEIARKPTIVEPEPADQGEAIVSDRTARSDRAADTEALKSVASPRPNPVRMREQSETVDSVLTSAVSPREQADSEDPASESSPVRSNPIRVTRGVSRGGNNPLR